MILDGKILAEKIKGEIKRKIAESKKQVKLAVVLVGEDPASCIYVRNKTKDCFDVGIICEEYRLSEDTKREELLSLIDRLNSDTSVNGILVQFPLPKHLSEDEVIKRIAPEKDVDGFSQINLGGVASGDENCFISCTPAGAMELIKSSGIEIKGKNAVVVGRSNNVGKPMALLLLNEDATVTVCHSKTENLSEFTENADILVSAVGKPHYITADMVKEGAVVIDIGISRVNGKQVGDVDFDNVISKAYAVTPNPGGTGPMTRAMLMVNTAKSAGII